MWLPKLFQKRFEGHSSSTPRKTRPGTAPSWRRLRLEPLEERTLLSVGFDPLRVGVWTEERIDDLGVWVESQTWPDVFGYGAPDRYQVTQLISQRLLQDPRGGYQTVMRIDVAPSCDTEAAADEVAELDFVTFARPESRSVGRYTSRSQELFDAITTNAPEGEGVFCGLAEDAVQSSYRPIEERTLLSVGPGVDLSAAGVSPNLAAVYAEYQDFVEGGGPPQDFVSAKADEFAFDGDMIYVETIGRGDFSTYLTTLVSFGFEVVYMAPSGGMVDGYLPLGQLESIVTATDTFSIAPAPKVTVPDLPRSPADGPDDPPEPPPDAEPDASWVVDRNLLYLSEEYEAFVAGGGRSEDFVSQRYDFRGDRVCVGIPPPFEGYDVAGLISTLAELGFSPRSVGGYLWGTLHLSGVKAVATLPGDLTLMDDEPLSRRDVLPPSPDPPEEPAEPPADGEPDEDHPTAGGDVTVQVVDGNLIITGDDLDNDISIRRTDNAGEYVVVGLHVYKGKQTLINAQAEPAFVTGVTGDFRISLNGGDDRVTLRGGLAYGYFTICTPGLAFFDVDHDSPFVVPTDLIVFPDVVHDTPLVVPGDLIVTATSGDNHVQLHYLDIAGDATVTTGSGDDFLDLFTLDVEGDLAVNTGAGNDDMRLIVDVRGQVSVQGSVVEDPVPGSTLEADGWATITGPLAAYWFELEGLDSVDTLRTHFSARDNDPKNISQDLLYTLDLSDWN